MVNELIFDEIINNLIVKGLLSGFILTILIGLFCFLFIKIWSMIKTFVR